ncbi:MAG: DUF2163 domain-containing protein [Rhodobacteraceae bacterium]|nr:DUF2163 domain-containing protein [Paracoccaceae bacterium]
MKQLPEGLANHLAGHVTTLAKCWLVTRADGAVIGFTDHDRSIEVEGVSCQPENALEVSSLVSATGFATGGGDVRGALSSTELEPASISASGLSDDDLEAGLWDGARVAMYLVNWQDPGQYLLVRRARIGEVSRAGEAFQAELRGLGHLLDVRQGRVFSRNCDADLGDTRCQLDLEDPQFKAQAIVSAIEAPGTLLVSGLDGFDSGWFSGGRLCVDDGPQQGFETEIAGHANELDASGPAATSARIGLWQAPPKTLEVGTQLTLYAGCDKRFETCRRKFSNTLNFQGFPHMPGTDFVLSYPARNTGENDGAPRVG